MTSHSIWKDRIGDHHATKSLRWHHALQFDEPLLQQFSTAETDNWRVLLNVTLLFMLFFSSQSRSHCLMLSMGVLDNSWYTVAVLGNT